MSACRFSSLDSLEELDLVAGRQRHERLLPVGAPAHEAAHALVLATNDQCVDVDDLDAEERLDRLLDLDFIGVDRDLEHDLRLERTLFEGPPRRAARVLEPRPLLGEKRTTNDLMT